MNATGNISTLLNENTWPVNNIWVIDVTPKGRNALYEYFPARSGNLKIEIKVKEATARGPHTILCYGLMDSVSEIDANNNVYKNWYNFVYKQPNPHKYKCQLDYESRCEECGEDKDK